MERNVKQLLLAMVMGFVMPALALRLGVQQPRQPQPSEPTTLPTQQSQAAERVTVPVWTEGEVQALELEEYVMGVVLAEMPASFETEALKAQAVAARTVALRSARLGDRHEGSAVCTDPGCCQAYMTEEAYLADGGREDNVEKVRSAVEATEGQVLTYGGDLIEAVYFSCSGGQTEDAAAVWGNDIPYLQSVESAGEEWAEHYWDSVRFTAGEFSAALGRSLTGSPKSWFGAVTYTPGGGVSTMMVAGKTYKGTELRQLLGLNSTVFSVEVAGDTITVFTRGKGHRVGLSQYGADAMAVQGSSYEEILLYYYRGARIDKMEDVG